MMPWTLVWLLWGALPGIPHDGLTITLLLVLNLLGLLADGAGPDRGRR